jgi:hypothetical protein
MVWRRRLWCCRPWGSDCGWWSVWDWGICRRVGSGCSGRGLGVGALGLFALAAGSAGLIIRELWVAVLVLGAVLGLVRARTLVDGQGEDFAPTEDSSASLSDVSKSNTVDPPSHALWRWAWLLLVPTVVLAVLAAAHAPGFLWAEEGYGYDVLEYHLQMPKEYYHAGAISYAPHNVYANFPAQVEMLYLYSMVLLDSDVDAGIACHFVHVAFGVLAVVAAWVVGRDRSKLAGMVAALALGSCGWLVYLSGLAYVELGLIFFGLSAAGVLLFVFDGGAEVTAERRTATRLLLVAGLLAGFACGCKYTAVPMVAAPLGMVVLLLPGRTWKQRATAVVVYGVGVLIAFGPWLVKNAAYTGNPVFPLANSVFEATPLGWSEAATQQWDAGHTFHAEENALATRLKTAWAHLPADEDQRVGLLMLLLGPLGLLARRRSRADGVLLLVLVVQLLVWIFATHVYARFAVVLLIPLTLLASRAWGEVETERGVQKLPRSNGVAIRSHWRPVLIAVALLVGVAANLYFARRMYAREGIGGAGAGWYVEGKVPGFEYYGYVNRQLPPDAQVLLVGEARPFYFEKPVDYSVVFNRSPLSEALDASTSPADLATLLRERGYTHVLVNWVEVRRLASTYGYDPRITPSLFTMLESQGWRCVQRFAHPNPHATEPYVDVYAVR